MSFVSWFMGRKHKRQRKQLQQKREVAGTLSVALLNRRFVKIGTSTGFVAVMAEANQGSYLPGMINEDVFDTLWNSKFYKITSVGELSTALMAVDYSVIQSRREGHVLVTSFLAKGVPGTQIFNEGQRFVRRTRGDIFIPDSDANFYGLLIGLASVLSHRDTITAKDTRAANAGAAGPTSERVAIGTDQGLQDNAKKFEELQKQLKLSTRSGDHTWDRARFEAKVAHWTLPAAALH